MKKVIFCGFGELGRRCLETLVSNNYEIVYVLTHKEINGSGVDSFARDNSIRFSYNDLRKCSDELLSEIMKCQADILVSVNYRYILEKTFYSLFDNTVNLHGSLLPKYRGRTPHVWSIINGEKYGGVTAHIIDDVVDAGDIIQQIEIKIEDDDTGATMLKKYEEVYPKLLLDALMHIEQGKPLRKQDENLASYFGKRISDMGYIDFYKEDVEVINFVRAQAKPYPGAYYFLSDGSRIVINKLEKVESETKFDRKYPIGVIFEHDNHYYVRCKCGYLIIVDYEI